MKRYIISSIFLFLSVFIIAQEAVWPVFAVEKNKEYPIEAVFEDGTTLPVNAVIKEGDDHFMDVKVIRDGEALPIKLIVSNDYYVPVKAILPDGKLVDIKANSTKFGLLDLKGVSRDGNTVVIAAITTEEDFLKVKAISPDGKSEREVRGIKFLASNEEMKIGDVKIQAHVKAIPVVDAKGIDSRWSVKAMNIDGEDMELVAVNVKGREFPVVAKMKGMTPCVLDVRATSSSLDIYVKLVKEGDRSYLIGIDDYYRKYEVKAKDKNGEYYEVIGLEKVGNLITIQAELPDGTLLPVKAVSSKDHFFDVKGIKLKEDEIEGTFYGEEDIIHYHAHVKAIVPIK